MSPPHRQLPPGRWAGGFTLSGASDFMLVTVTDDGTATLDLPNQMRFNLPATSGHADGDRLGFTLAGLRFAIDQVDSGAAQGRCMAGSTEGAFSLRLSRDLPPGAFAKWMGHYAPPSGPDLMLSQDLRPEGALYFCLRGDEIVRLHALASDEFLSEANETFVLSGAAASASLRWQAPGAALVELARREPYREETFHVPVGDHVIAGTLLLPPGPGPHPAVLLCHHADTPGRDYYRLFAAPFAQRGLAAFIYDKRGWGDSTGERLGSQVFDLADDAAAVYRALALHAAIRPGGLGLWGISNGAWVAAEVAARLAAEYQPPAFVVAASLAGVTPARQEQVRRVNVARGLGASERALELLDRFWGRFFRFAVEGGWDAELEALVAAVYADDELRRLPPHPTHGPGLQPVPPLASLEELQAEAGTWTDGGFDPSPHFAALPAPVLCVWGADDDVIPLDESVARMRAALIANGQALCQAHVLPAADHLLYATPPAPEGLPADVMQRRLHQTRLAPGARELMVEWTAKAVAQEEPPNV